MTRREAADRKISLRSEATVNPETARPYQGLRPYTEQDRGNFFGRDADRDILIDKILDHRLTLLFAASGVGKSSLLQAAVLPRLKDPEHENLDVIYYKDWVKKPLAGLKDAILDYLRQRQRIRAETSIAPESASLADFCKFCSVHVREPLVLILDQFEEFFQYHRYGDAFQGFISQLTDTVLDREAPVSVVLSMREDFALELNAFKPEMPGLLFENFYRLEKLTRANAEIALREPVERIGFRYEPALEKQLLDDLAVREQSVHPSMPVTESIDTIEPPYLQMLCEQLWDLEKANPKKMIRLETYTERGGAKGLMKSYVGSYLDDFSQSERILASLAFDHLVSRRGTKVAYSAAALAKLGEVDEAPLAAVLEKLEEARILRKQSREGVDWYELYHDLFSDSVGEWNEAYKARMRRRRAQKQTALIALILLLLFAAFDGIMNATRHYLRYTPSRQGNDTIELYRGQPGTPDIFGLRRFLAETKYQGAKVEPDQRFETRPVSDLKEINTQLIRLRRSMDRIEPYWQDGQIERALETARDLTQSEGIFDARGVIDLLANLKSEASLTLLAEALTKLDSAEPGYNPFLAALREKNSALAKELLRKEFERHGSPWRSLIADTLLNSGEAIDTETLLDLIRSQSGESSRSQRQAAVAAISALGPHEALSRAIQLFEEGTGGLRYLSLEVLEGLDLPETEAWLRRRLEIEEESQVVSKIRKILSTEEVDSNASISKIDRGEYRNESTRFAFAFPESELHNIYTTMNRYGLRGDFVPDIYTLAKSDHPEVTDHLIRFLSYEDVVRISAILMLGLRREDAATTRLIELLGDRNRRVRLAALVALGKISNRKAIRAVIDTLVSSNYLETRATALKILADIWPIGRDWFKPEEAVLKNEEFSLIRNALTSLLDDPEIELRVGAVSALAASHSDESVAALLLILDDDPDVVVAAIDAIARLARPKAIESLVPLVREGPTRTRVAAANALMALGHTGSTRLLASMLEENEDAFIRLGAVRALSKGRGVAQHKTLLALVGDSDAATRRTAARVLSAIPFQPATRTFERLLSDEDPQVMESALESFFDLGTSRHMSAIKAAQKARRFSIRGRASNVLNHWGTPFAHNIEYSELSSPNVFWENDEPKARNPIKSSRIEIRNTAKSNQLLGYGAQEELLAELYSDRWQQRQDATLGLSTSSRPDARRLLALQLRDSNPEVRLNAKVVLGLLTNPRIFEPLVHLLDSGFSSVSASATRIIREFLSTEAPDDLNNLLTAGLMDASFSADARTRRAILLSDTGHAAALAWLESRIQEEAIRMDRRLELAGTVLRRQDSEATKTFLRASLEDPRLNSRLKARAAAGLLASGATPVRWLEEVAGTASGWQSPLRLQLIEALGAYPSSNTTQFLLSLLDDASYRVRAKAITALAETEAQIDPQHLAPLLTDPYINVQQAAAHYLGVLSTPSSVDLLSASILNPETPISTQQVQLEALARINTAQAIEVILEAILEFEPILGLSGYRKLRELKATSTVPTLHQRLDEITAQYHAWRLDRDERRGKSEEELPDDPPEERPNEYLTFELAFTLSHLAGEKTGLELLAHPLADVRGGAALGLGTLGTPTLIQRLQELRTGQEPPWVVHAAYRAIDHVLVHLELTGEPQDLAALREMLDDLGADTEDNEDANNGLRDRLRWTVRELGARIGQIAEDQVPNQPGE